LSQRDAIVAEIPGLRRYARALTGEAARADDLVQDTLERALAKWSLWRPGNLRAWLFSIMHNVFVNQLRSIRAIDYVEDPGELAPGVPPAHEDAAMVRDLERALAKLPTEQREVLLLIGLEELGYAEAAKALGIPVGTVMSRLSRARERLRALLRGEAGSSLRVVK
jgi:RNA polymerase sigma-70 factor (ECF subfamily)